MQPGKWKVLWGYYRCAIPVSAQVIRDEYRKMGPGYSQVLEVNLEAKAKNELLQSILQSHYFKHTDTIINPLNPMPLIQRGKYKGLGINKRMALLSMAPP